MSSHFHRNKGNKECTPTVFPHLEEGGNYTRVLSPSIRWRNTVRGSVFLFIHKVRKQTEVGRRVHFFSLSMRWRNTVRSTLFLLICKVEKKRTTEFLVVFCAALSSQEALFTLLHVTIYKEKKPVLIFFEKESTPSTLQMERECTVAFLHLMDEEKECTPPPPQCFSPPYG